MRKFAIFLIIIIFVISGCDMINDNQNASDRLTSDQKEQIVQPSNNKNPLNIVPNEYELLIKDYNELVYARSICDFEEKYNNDEINFDSITSRYIKNGTKLHYNLECMIIEMGSVNDESVTFNYYFEDMNNDGTKEAIWLKNENTVIAVFSIVNNEVCLLDAFWSKYSCDIKEGDLYIISSDGVDSSYFVKQVKDQSYELNTLQEFGMELSQTDVLYYEIENDVKKEINESDFKKLVLAFRRQGDEGEKGTVLPSPFQKR